MAKVDSLMCALIDIICESFIYFFKVYCCLINKFLHSKSLYFPSDLLRFVLSMLCVDSEFPLFRKYENIQALKDIFKFEFAVPLTFAIRKSLELQVKVLKLPS
jgi:hypothetical protein